MRGPEPPGSNDWRSGVGAAEVAVQSGAPRSSTPGMRLTMLTLYVDTPPNEALILIPDPEQADYRRVEYRNVYVECGGSAGNAAAGGVAGSRPVAGSAGTLVTAGSTGILGAGAARD